MANRKALTRGGPLEATVLENLRAGHSVRAACAAANVAVRSYYNHHQRSQAFRHDVEVAQQEAERRLVGRVLEAADGGDVKAAMWLLERRWPGTYAAPLRVDARVDTHHELDVEIVALAQRYTGLTAEETEREIERLSRIVEQPASAAAGAVPGDSGRSTAAPGAAAGGEGGPGAALPRSAGEDGHGVTAGTVLPADSRDEAPTAAPEPVGAADSARPTAGGPRGAPQPMEPLPPLAYHRPEPPVVCPHCRGAHERDCPIAVEGLRIDPADLLRIMGDPR